MPNKQVTTTFQPALKVNSGEPKKTEVHLWKGNTTWQVNGKRLVAAVSADRTWFWVRFEGRDEPLPPELHAQMTNAGFYWGKKPRNLGYFGESSEAKVALLRSMSFHQAKHITEPVVAPVAKVTSNVEHPAKVEPKGKLSSTPTGNSLKQTGKHYVAYNAAGRPVWADTGYFVSAAELVAMGIKQVDTKPGQAPSFQKVQPPAQGPAELMAEYFNLTSVDDKGNQTSITRVVDGDLVTEDIDPSDAYQFGFEMGRYDRDNGTSSKDVWLQGYEAGMQPDPEPEPEVASAQDTELRQLVLMLAAQQQDQAKQLSALIAALGGK